MIVLCPKCKMKLRVDDAKLSPEGSRFKCPKCSTILAVRKPAAAPKREISARTVLVAHGTADILEQALSLLSGRGFRVITSTDGIDAMVTALKELPAVLIVDAALPKIYGFEVCKRLRARAETKDMKIILLGSVHDKSRYRRDPVSLYGADDYIEDHEISSVLLERVKRLLEPGQAPSTGEQPPQSHPEQKAPETGPPTEEAAPPFEPVPDEGVERARRLSRTIINDIYLYNAAKLDQSVKNESFYTVFAAELKEGQKLYNNRIPQEVRNKGDFFHEAIENFLGARKKVLS